MREPQQELYSPSQDPKQLDLFAEALEVERERIRSQDRRTEVVRAAIDANDAADKRQFEFHMAKLDEEKQQRIDKTDLDRTRITLAGRIALAFGGSFILLTTVFVSMLFFGNPSQSEIAKNALTTLGNGIGGFGVIYAATAAFRALVGRR